MRLQVKGRNVELSESVRDYAEQKLSKLERQLAAPTQVEVELSVEHNPSIAASHVAEATIWTKGPTLRAREASPSFEASIDELVHKLERQVKRYREKRRHEHEWHQERSNGGMPAAASTPSEEGTMIVKTKQFVLNGMTAEEAVEQLELIGHDFFVFRNADSGEINVVYRRRDGDYGVIEPA